MKEGTVADAEEEDIDDRDDVLVCHRSVAQALPEHLAAFFYR